MNPVAGEDLVVLVPEGLGFLLDDLDDGSVSLGVGFGHGGLGSHGGVFALIADEGDG
jgi:hypothetical protein